HHDTRVIHTFPTTLFRSHRRAWIYSLSIGLLLAIASPEISRYLNLPTTVFLRLLAAGIVFYIPLGVRRGLLQGSCDFRALAVNRSEEHTSELQSLAYLVC